MVFADSLEVFGWLKDGWVALGGVGRVADELCVGFWRVRGRWRAGEC